MDIIIETPRGKGYKVDFDPETGYYKLKKILPTGLVFPFDFGFIPGTVGEDGDPLDVLVISEIETFVGCALECRIIGAVKAMQEERNGDRMRNDRLIAIPLVSVQYAKVATLTQLPLEILAQIESFFSNYNQQAGKEFKVLARLGAREANKLIKNAMKEEKQTMLIQLQIPLYRQNGKKFPDQYYTALNEELTENFGGLTIYNRSAAEGGRKESIIVYEVMAAEVDMAFWQRIKKSLVKRFGQQEVVITCSKIARI